MISQHELIDYLEDSARTYRFLSQVFFKELTEETVEALSRESFPSDTGNELLDSGYRLIKRFFSFSPSDPRTQLACEYARIFLAAGVFTKDEITAVPYESVFTSEERIMMQGSRDDVVACFLRDGFKVDPSLHEPEDHIAFELEYLATMNERALNAAQEKSQRELRENLSRQYSFIESHLPNWIPQLQEAAQAYAKTPFYIGMLMVTRGALEQSLGMIEAVVEQIDGAAVKKA